MIGSEQLCEEGQLKTRKGKQKTYLRWSQQKEPRDSKAISFLSESQNTRTGSKSLYKHLEKHLKSND